MNKTSAVMVPCVVLFVLAYLSAQAFAVGPDRTLTWQGGGQGQVVFEGKKHAGEGYGCKDCHPGLFSMKQGSASMTMAAMGRGEQCGACHNGTTAFAVNDPKKCHECHRQGGRHGKKHKGHAEKREHHDEGH